MEAEECSLSEEYLVAMRVPAAQPRDWLVAERT